MLKKVKIDRYFLTEQCPFSKKRKVKPKAIWTTLGAATFVFIVSVIFIGGNSEKDGGTASPSSAAASSGETTYGGAVSQKNDSFWFSSTKNESRSPARHYSASQLVKRGDASSGDKLPMGSTIPVKLANTVISSDGGAPVIAEVMDDILWKNSMVIPTGTRAIGQASFDDTAKRLQVRFQTLVFPEGEQHSVSGLALLPDGSSGLPGDYHSGQATAQAGRFLGYFVGGLSSGMKDKTSSQGQFGVPYEPGSLKNGILNGLSQSATDQANQYAESMKTVRPYLEVPAGIPFLLYLEKEFP